MCASLNADYAVVKGQIAHIDHDSSNDSLDNLVWLCLLHHDEYDSRTSQSKGFRPLELKKYRSNLYDYVRCNLSVPISESDPIRPWNGAYFDENLPILFLAAAFCQRPSFRNYLIGAIADPDAKEHLYSIWAFLDQPVKDINLAPITNGELMHIEVSSPEGAEDLMKLLDLASIGLHVMPESLVLDRVTKISGKTLREALLVLLKIRSGKVFAGTTIDKG